MPKKVTWPEPGTRMGNLTAVEPIGHLRCGDRERPYLLCKCDCGEYAGIALFVFTRGGQLTCGCYVGTRNMQYDRLKPGDKFHDWTVIRNVDPAHKVGKGYLCRCVCGTEKVVSARLMRSGGSKSCGCRRKGWYERKYGKSAERKI